MQTIIKILDYINDYIGYVYIVICVVVMVMLVRVLLALIKLTHSTTDFSAAIVAVNESYANYRDNKKRVRSFSLNVLRVVAAYKLARIYLSREKRAELRNKKDEVTIHRSYDKYVKRLLND